MPCESLGSNAMFCAWIEALPAFRRLVNLILIQSPILALRVSGCGIAPSSAALVASPSRAKILPAALASNSLRSKSTSISSSVLGLNFNSLSIATTLKFLAGAPFGHKVFLTFFLKLSFPGSTFRSLFNSSRTRMIPQLPSASLEVRPL